MKTGDKIYWNWSTTRGYGYSRKIPAIIVGFTKKKVKIKVVRKVYEYGKPPKFVEEIKHVNQDKISPRKQSYDFID